MVKLYLQYKVPFYAIKINEGLEVVHYSTQKQLADVLTKVIKTKYFIHLRDKIGVVDFILEYGLRDSVECNPNSTQFSFNSCAFEM